MGRMPKIFQHWEDSKKRLDKTNWRCSYCDFDFLFHPSAFGAITFDHLISRSSGGKDGDNLVPACRLCNSIKGKKVLGNNVNEVRHRLDQLREEYLKKWGYYDLKQKIRP